MKPRDVDHVLHFEAEGAERGVLLELVRAGEPDPGVVDLAHTEAESRSEAVVAERVTGMGFEGFRDL